MLDEADRMLDMGFIDDVERILDATPKERQTALFSATMPGPILELSRKYMNSPEHVRVSEDSLTVEGIKQYYVSVESNRKLGALMSFFKTRAPTSTLVFCRTKHGADRLAHILESNGIKALAMHGNLTQARREQVLQLFRDGEIQTLIATDLAARGLDIDDISHVVNFDLPEEPTNYIHRIGRTGRAGKTGEAVTFTTNLLEIRELQKVENMTGVPIEELKLPEYQGRFNMPPREERHDYRGGGFGHGGGRGGGSGFHGRRPQRPGGHFGSRPQHGGGPRPSGFRSSRPRRSFH